MKTTPGTPNASRHILPTKLLHAGLALAVITQLATSLVLKPAEEGHAGNLAFEVHEYSGMIAFAFVLGIWLVVVFRRRGTAAGALWPWFSGARRTAVWADIKVHIASLKQRQLPAHNNDAALPSAIHGLGVLLITAMAATGTVYYFVNSGNPDAGGLVGIVMFIHTTLANLVWAYLIGHASFAILQHFFNNYSLGHMWSLGSNKSKGK